MTEKQYKGIAGNFLICDVQKEYAEHLLSILVKRFGMRFQFHFFSNVKKIEQFAEKAEIEILLIAEDCVSEIRGNVKAKKKFILSESMKKEEKQGETTIFRYQSADEILKIIQSGIGEEEAKAAHKPQKKTEEKYDAVQSDFTAPKRKIGIRDEPEESGLIGIYSPIHRIGKTEFALCLGEKISEKVPTLYINMEGYSGNDFYFKGEKNQDLGDLLYYLKQERIDYGLKASLMTGQYKQSENIFYEKEGKLYRTNRHFFSESRLCDVIQQIVGEANRYVNETSPIVDARLADGSRVNVVLKPVAVNGPIMTIRKFPSKAIKMNDLIKMGSLTKEAAEFIRKIVRSKYNIFVSGGTGAGKTTFLNAMSDFIPKEERVITIEDNAELQIQGVENLVRLEAREANLEGEGAVTIRDLIKSALRMRPDRIIVGEVRGEETVDMISSAMLNGHSGSMSTGHANNPKDMLHRIETMMMMGIDLPLQAIQRQVASALDIIIHLGRIRDKTRKVLMIEEILGYEDGKIQTKTLYEFKEVGTENEKVKGSIMKVAELENTGKLVAAGY